jgi:Zinc finger, C3HC4 type (RING finger)
MRHEEWPFNLVLDSYRKFEECPICLENHKEKVVMLECGHVFCYDCIYQCQRCALCRIEIPQYPIIVIPFTNCGLEKRDEIWFSPVVPSKTGVVESSNHMSKNQAIAIRDWIANHHGSIYCPDGAILYDENQNNKWYYQTTFNVRQGRTLDDFARYSLRSIFNAGLEIMCEYRVEHMRDFINTRWPLFARSNEYLSWFEKQIDWLVRNNTCILEQREDGKYLVATKYN